jgi:hydrogenase nickel incorporation protein HypA/HybF
MHEMSIAQSLVDLIAEQLDATPGVRVGGVCVRVGALSGVVPAALRSAWPAAARGTVAARAVLRIDEQAVVVHCPACGGERAARGVQSLRCATCGAPSADVRRGRELELVSLEVFDDEATDPGSADADPEEQ